MTEQKTGVGPEIITKLLELEKENSLFDYTVKGIPVWLFIRSLLPEYINSGSFCVPHRMMSFKKKLGILFVFLRASIAGLMKIRKLRKARRWFIAGGADRSYFPGYGNVNVFFDLLLDHSAQENDVILELPTFTSSLHKENNYKPERIVCGDFLYFLEFFVRYHPSAEERNTLKRVAEIAGKMIEELNGNPIEGVAGLFYDHLLRNIKRYNVFRLLFSICRPKKIVMLACYTSTPILLIHHAKQKGTQIVEFQHAHIYPQHIGYRYDAIKPGDLASIPLPDKIVTFGQYYKDLLIRQSWRGDNIMIVGNPNTTTCRILDKYHNNGVLNDVTKPFKYVIVIVSQYTIIETFIEFLRDTGNHDDCLFIIKTHPKGSGERMAYERSLNIGRNIIFCPSGLHLWDLFQYASAAIGVYSTGILDALSFGIPAFCLRSSLTLYFADLIENGYMEYVQSIGEMKSKIVQSQKMKTVSLYKDMSFDVINFI
ncbi:MAG: hypothetical protein A4E74_01737 [Syntrophus sp. PtaB.Bin075]|nr:MAG: hypothetical protein A4E74_01737 [Syntrophus sp. PtaB.Bin075]